MAPDLTSSQSTAVIFDVDDTLVQTGSLELDCFPSAVRDVLGPVSFRPSWGDYEHVSDAGILAQVCADNGLKPVGHDDVKQRFFELVAKRLTDNPMMCQPTPGAVQLLTRLASTPGMRVGVATGGWAETARLKLRHAGVATELAALASSNDAMARTEIMQTCLRKMGPPPARVVYVGDGRWDAEASEALGWSFIAVGAMLKDQGHRWVQDFDGPDFDTHLAVFLEDRDV